MRTVKNADIVNNNLNNLCCLDNYFKMSEELNKTQNIGWQ